MQLSQGKLPVSIVIPARNEAKNLYHFLPSIPANIGEIILVDGHSTDDTIAIAQKLRPDIRIIRQVGEGKVGGAVTSPLYVAQGIMLCAAL